MQRPLIINPKPSVAPAVQFLFLSEGYSDEVEFRQHVDRIFQAFLTIAPFNQAKHKIAAWAHFVPSNDGQITNVEQNTAFKFFISEDGKLTTLRPQRLIDAINNIQVEIPHIDNPLQYVDGAEVWLSWRLIPEESIVCVLSKSTAPSSNTLLEWPSGLLEPNALTIEIRELLPCIFLSSWVLGTSHYTNPEMAVALVFAKQVGLVFGLADELEYEGDEYHNYPEIINTDIEEPLWPNVTAHASLLDNNGHLQIDQLKWRYLIPMKRLTNGIAESQYPIPSANATDTEIYALHGNIAEIANSSVLLLRHPSWIDPTKEGPNLERYVEWPKEPLKLSGEVNLFEGAAGYRQGLYRSSSECLMRFEGYNVTTGNKDSRQPVNFCPVCYEHLRRRLSGFSKFSLKLGSIRIKTTITGCHIERDCQKVSALSTALTNYILNETDTLEFKLGPNKCTEATIKRFTKFFNDKLHYPLSCRIPVNDPRWTQPHYDLPYLRGDRTYCRDAFRAWHIWNTVLEKLPYWNSLEFAGLGGAGAIIYLGFGYLINRRETRTMLLDDGREIYYQDVIPLEPEDFTKIQPGAILQTWGLGTYDVSAGQDTYRQIVAYIEQSRFRLESNQQPLDPPSSKPPGHSVFFVGLKKDENNNYIKDDNDNFIPLVADQYGTTKPLTTGYRANYAFWIAAQWFDATGVNYEPFIP